MTVRTDITVNHNRTPRIITVAAPSVSLTIQDLVDTLRFIEDDFACISYPKLLDAAGKAQLSAALFTGITVTLQDAAVCFEARTTPKSSGTVTTGGTITLIDSAATFITDGINSDHLVVNFSDRSAATVIAVDSETQLTIDGLSGGTENDFDIGEVYRIYEVFECTISGGNLVAVNLLDVAISPTFPTFGTQIVRESDTSAALVETATSGLTASESLQLAEISSLKKLMRNRLLIDTTTNTLTIYDDDATTPLFTFDLKDSVGAPTSTSVYERVPT